MVILSSIYRTFCKIWGIPGDVFEKVLRWLGLLRVLLLRLRG